MCLINWNTWLSWALTFYILEPNNAKSLRERESRESLSLSSALSSSRVIENGCFGLSIHWPVCVSIIVRVPYFPFFSPCWALFDFDSIIWKAETLNLLIRRRKRRKSIKEIENEWGINGAAAPYAFLSLFHTHTQSLSRTSTHWIGFSIHIIMWIAFKVLFMRLFYL